MLFSIIEVIAFSEHLCNTNEGDFSNSSECQGGKPTEHSKNDDSNKTYRFNIDGETIRTVDFSRPKEELIENMIKDYETSEDYDVKYFVIETYEIKTEGYEYQDMELDASDEVLKEIVMILNKANNTQRFKVDDFTYQNELTPYEEQIKKNLGYSNNPAIVEEFIKETDEIWENSLKHMEYANELVDLCKKPEIEKYIEYFNAFYNEILTFAERLSECGINVIKNFGEELGRVKEKIKIQKL